MIEDGFKFDLNAKKFRLSNEELLASIKNAAENFGGNYYFSTIDYDKLSGRNPHSSTIIERFGSWKNALARIGINDGRVRRYSPEELIDNLERAWRELGYPPSKRQINKLADKISEAPYKKHWGSVRTACETLASFHENYISRDELLAGKITKYARKPIPLKDRFAILKRDNYRCVKCGASPAADQSVILEIDHIIPVANGGMNDLSNFQTLCRKCNQGKKDREN